MRIRCREGGVSPAQLSSLAARATQNLRRASGWPHAPSSGTERRAARQPAEGQRPCMEHQGCGHRASLVAQLPDRHIAQGLPLGEFHEPLDGPATPLGVRPCASGVSLATGVPCRVMTISSPLAARSSGLARRFLASDAPIVAMAHSTSREPRGRRYSTTLRWPAVAPGRVPVLVEHVGHRAALARRTCSAPGNIAEHQAAVRRRTPRAGCRPAARRSCRRCTRPPRRPACPRA